VLDRIVRNTAVSCVVIAVIAAAWTRGFRAPLGVLGGGLLIGLSYWAIRGTVDALIAIRSGLSRHSGGAAKADETPGKPTGLQLVKFFTRHGMLALAAYVMMVRLHLDPVGLLAGVSSLAVAVAVEVLRDLRWRRSP
jgi:hypothetical protein